MQEDGFTRIRIKDSDHDRITARVRHDIKIHDVITQALDALGKVEAVAAATTTHRSKQRDR